MTRFAVLVQYTLRQRKKLWTPTVRTGVAMPWIQKVEQSCHRVALLSLVLYPVKTLNLVPFAGIINKGNDKQCAPTCCEIGSTNERLLLWYQSSSIGSLNYLSSHKSMLGETKSTSASSLAFI